MQSRLCAALIGTASVVGFVCEAGAQTEPAPLTRQDALSRALGDDPGARAGDAARDAAAASVGQARRWTNPSLEVVQENVSGSGPYQGTGRAETTWSLRQPLGLGGDRSARRRLAERDLDAAIVSADIRRLDLIEEVEHAYTDAQAAEAALKVAQDRLDVARELASAVERRVEAARDPLMATSRAQARLAEAEIELESARRTASIARSQLASYWGGAADFRVETASFNQLQTSDIAGQTPDLDLADAEAARADAQIAVERARAFPDVDLQMGWREFRETNETALVFGFSVPLQLWDRNASGIARARADSARASYERDALARRLARQHAMLRSQIEIAQLEIEALDARVLPMSERALDQAREGYSIGGFSYLDVLDAQRALADARLRRISALRTYHRAQASLERLAGAHAEEFSQ